MPKTLIFAKDDSHADDIVQIVREEFGKGNDFCQKITYKTGTARIVDQGGRAGRQGGREGHLQVDRASRPRTCSQSFRNSYNPRIVVTVDMIATGTDIKPLEIVMFMRAVKSRNFFEQMKGRGVRVINGTDFQAVTPDARRKTHFVIVDCVGVCEQELSDTQPLERKPTVSFEKLLQAVAFGSTDPDVLSSLAGRLARLDRQLGATTEAGGRGRAAPRMSRPICSTPIDADVQDGGAQSSACRPASSGRADRKAAEADRARPAGRSRPTRRCGSSFVEVKKPRADHRHGEQGRGAGGRLLGGRESAPRRWCTAFEPFLQEHKDEITALQILYAGRTASGCGSPTSRRWPMRSRRPPRSWTPERLWRAYETLRLAGARGAARCSPTWFRWCGSR